MLGIFTILRCSFLILQLHCFTVSLDGPWECVLSTLHNEQYVKVSSPPGQCHSGHVSVSHLCTFSKLVLALVGHERIVHFNVLEVVRLEYSYSLACEILTGL